MRSNAVSRGVKTLLSERVFLTFVAGTTVFSGLVVLAAWLSGVSWIAALIPVGPGLMTVILTLRRNESGRLNELIRSLLDVRVDGKWLAVSLLLLPAIALCALVLYAVTGDSDLTFGAPHFVAIIGALPLLLCNELGWRGFAPRQLPVRYGLFTKSIIIGVAWFISVLPMYLIDTADLVDIPPHELGLALIPMSTLMFWLKANTRSLLMPALFGASGVVILSLLPILPEASVQGVTFWLVVAFLWLAAIVVAGYYGTDGLDRSIHELPPDELPVDWEKIMPRGDDNRKGVFGSRNGRSVPNRKSFSAVGKKTRRS